MNQTTPTHSSPSLEATSATLPILKGQVIHHQIPDDFKKHPNTPWHALRSLSADPYVISLDEFGAASNIWLADADGIRLVSSLTPPLPGNILIWRAKCLYSAEHSLLIIAFNTIPHVHQFTPENTGGLIRAYNISSGVLQQEVKIDSLQLDSVFTASPSSKYLAAAVAKPRQIALYQIHSQGLTHIRRVSYPHPPPRMSYYFPIHVGDDGSVLSSTTIFPSPCLSLHLHALDATPDIPQATVAIPGLELDYLVPSGSIMTSPSCIVVAISGSDSAFDHHYGGTSICALTMPSLSKKWNVNIEEPGFVPKEVKQLSYHSALGMVVVLQVVSNQPGLTFIDVQNGSVIRRAFTSPQFDNLNYFSFCIRCTNKDEYVCVLPNGKIAIEPLRRILESGLSEDAQEKGTEEEEVPVREVTLEVQSTPVKPEPWKAKARRLGEMWQWVDHVAFVSHGAVLLSIRGPETFYVNW
ncbi:hypothetical protein BGZ63DRAFT_50915 [Mariannaea sp. PMI_226]|nr:hypothetical protein BGZ63DRAFT_50915 [Mariannaea sp. PMI_226]